MIKRFIYWLYKKICKPREKRIYTNAVVISEYEAMLNQQTNELVDYHVRKLVARLGEQLLLSKEIEVRSHKNYNGDTILETIIRI